MWILKGAKWFHFTGITPALGGELPAICLDALKVCKANKVCKVNKVFVMIIGH